MRHHMTYRNSDTQMDAHTHSHTLSVCHKRQKPEAKMKKKNNKHQLVSFASSQCICVYSDIQMQMLFFLFGRHKIKPKLRCHTRVRECDDVCVRNTHGGIHIDTCFCIIISLVSPVFHENEKYKFHKFERVAHTYLSSVYRKYSGAH